MIATLLELVNAAHGTSFAAHGRYPTGEQGAFSITETDGTDSRRFVLKWGKGTNVPDELRQAAVITARLRDNGYPASRYRLFGVAPTLGVVYSVQEELSGAPLGGRLDRALVDRLLELNALQAELALAPTGDWPRPLVDTVLHGGDGYCLPETLRSTSAETAALLATLQRLATVDLDRRPPAVDVVHFDFQGTNILAAENEISGVVDWEGCLPGDRRFDLATLYFYAAASDEAEPDQVDRLWRLLLAHTGRPLLGVYLAHLVLRQVDWSLRFHHRSEVERWLGHADVLLRRHSALGEHETGA